MPTVLQRLRSLAHRVAAPERRGPLRGVWIIALGIAAALGSCQPLITINPETGRRKADEGKPLCERVVSRMMRCSSEAEFRERLTRERDRAVKACETAGREDAERCEKQETCEGFVRCLRE